MLHFYQCYHFGGMHLIWCILWLMVLVWIFAMPYDLPGRCRGKISPLNILRNGLPSR